MRVFAIHDAAGHILEVMTCPEDSPPPVGMTQPGLTMTEIDVPPSGAAELGFPEDPTQLPEGNQARQGLEQFAERYRVQVVPGQATLEEY